MQINAGWYVEISGGLIAAAIRLPAPMGEATKDDKIQASVGPTQCKRGALWFDGEDIPSGVTGALIKDSSAASSPGQVHFLTLSSLEIEKPT